MSAGFDINRLASIAHDTVPKGGSVWLYGSRAREEASEDSDWDILILLDKPSIEPSDFDKISFPMIEYGWHYGADLSPQLYTNVEWRKMFNTPYCQNVEHDKRLIYESK